MRRLFGLVVAALLAMGTQADAGYRVYIPKVVKVTGKSTVTHGSQGQKFLCLNPGGLVVCIVGGMIVVDEAKRIIEGPACATGKMTRRSWFGVVKDEPTLWRPYCNWKGSKTVVAGGGKLWPKGK